MRADAGFWSYALIDTLSRLKVRWSITVRIHMDGPVLALQRVQRSPPNQCLLGRPLRQLGQPRSVQLGSEGGGSRLGLGFGPFSITDISNELGAYRYPHSSHRVGMDVDVNLQFLFVDPCTAGGDIRIDPNNPTDRCATTGETKGTFFRDSVEQQIVETVTATTYAFWNFSRLVYFDDCDSASYANGVLGRPAYVQFYPGHYDHYHTTFCLLQGRTDFNYYGNYTC